MAHLCVKKFHGCKHRKKFSKNLISPPDSCGHFETDLGQFGAFLSELEHFAHTLDLGDFGRNSENRPTQGSKIGLGPKKSTKSKIRFHSLISMCLGSNLRKMDFLKNVSRKSLRDSKIAHFRLFSRFRKWPTCVSKNFTVASTEKNFQKI